MGNTTFYREAQKEDSKITWKDIFSESFRPHTKEERDYAMTVGTSLQQVSESNMLQTWHKPWLWFYYGKFGAALIVILFVAKYICEKLGSLEQVMTIMLYILAPTVIPLIVMIFLWELNVPQNLSLGELFVCFLLGSILSFVLTSALSSLMPNDLPAYCAPLQEEPAKLIPSLLFLWYFEKNGKKIYGMTGLVIGGAVGAGFAAFESIIYAFGNGTDTVIDRMIWAVGGHMVYAAPYVAAFALAVHKYRHFSLECFRDKDFWGAYIISNILHAAWNWDGRAIGATLYYVGNIALVILKWMVLLYWVRKCMTEVVREGHYFSGSGGIYTPVREKAQTLCLTCVAGPQQGQMWNSSSSQFVIGRDPYNCNIPLSGNPHGVSRQHCSIQRTSAGWTVKDLNSTYGTYLPNGKLAPGAEAQLYDGELIYLGSKLVCFRVYIR